MRRSFVLLFSFMAACNPGHSNKEKQSSLTDTGGSSNDVQQQITGHSNSYKQLRTKNELVGIWTSDNKEPLTVNITPDSIYYTEHFESYKYNLKVDSIFISYPDFIFAAKVYFNKDTLVMESENGAAKYHRFKG